MITDKTERIALDDPVALAMAVLVDRIRTLPKEDRDDLLELSRAFFTAENQEEQDSATLAMREIMEQTPTAVRKADILEEPGDDLQKWIDFVSGKIRELRTNVGLTQVQLAEKSGLPQSHISRLEAGKHSPSFVTLEKIAKALGVDVAEFDPSA